ncbi:MAG TPA: agmatine deiminase family protein [Candidatus Binatia bacterium]|nr:agmatine deiminase family protein [Candidatus Binatia bacterium]
MNSSPAKKPTPRSKGYAMPAEWAPHDATWLAWPHNRETWPTQLGRVQDIWLNMIVELARSEQVNLLVNDATMESEVAARLQAAGAMMPAISFLRIPTVDVWARDYGPTFITRSTEEEPLACNDWIFNGWGGKYKAYEEDDSVAKQIAARLGIPVFTHPLVLEGGSIEVNGAGVVLTTTQCLLNKNRNPHLTQNDIERFLNDTLGTSHVIWLGEGISGDDTDGHIDDIARFVSATKVVCVRETSARDENYAPLEENYERLMAARDASGVKFEVISLPSPRPIAYEGARLPASYANFYIANNLVLVPVFGDPADARALGILSEVFPGRKIVGLNCADVVAGLGAIHCVTQQQPRTA